MLADALTILETSSDEVLPDVKSIGSGIICVKKTTKPMPMRAKYDDSNKIFFLLGKSTNAIKRILNGKNPKVSGCENVAQVKENADKGQLLNIKYIESRKNIIHIIG